MTTYFRYLLILIVSLSAAFSSLKAQESNEIAWLAHIPRPVVSLDVMKISWDEDKSSYVFNDVIVDWVMSADSISRGHSIRRVFNCMPLGRFSDANGDSVSAEPSSAKIELTADGGAIMVYRVTIPMVTDEGVPATAPISGGLNMVFGASKLVDRKHSVEHTFSKLIELPLKE